MIPGDVVGECDDLCVIITFDLAQLNIVRIACKWIDEQCMNLG